MRDKLAGKGIRTSVELGDLLYDHPHHIAVVAGDYLIMPPESLTFRVASVYYDGKQTMEAYLEEPPKGADAERAFVESERTSPSDGRSVSAGGSSLFEIVLDFPAEGRGTSLHQGTYSFLRAIRLSYALRLKDLQREGKLMHP